MTNPIVEYIKKIAGIRTSPTTRITTVTTNETLPTDPNARRVQKRLEE